MFHDEIVKAQQSVTSILCTDLDVVGIGRALKLNELWKPASVPAVDHTKQFHCIHSKGYGKIDCLPFSDAPPQLAESFRFLTPPEMEVETAVETAARSNPPPRKTLQPKSKLRTVRGSLPLLREEINKAQESLKIGSFFAIYYPQPTFYLGRVEQINTQDKKVTFRYLEYTSNANPKTGLERYDWRKVHTKDDKGNNITKVEEETVSQEYVFAGPLDLSGPPFDVKDHYSLHDKYTRLKKLNFFTV
jgi:hypothetical protein